MKLSAAFQIVLLLVTCVVPEGRHLLAPGQICSHECGCSEESRRDGSCCCAGKKSDRNDQQASVASGGCCHAAGAAGKNSADDVAAKRCGAKKQSSSCCSTVRESSDELPPGVEIAACPCGGDVHELLVILMPRTSPVRVELANVPSLSGGCRLLDEHSVSDQPPPESPPPENRPC